jgi:16S rRNA (guanine527-N7)-methyltransferase
MTTGSLIDDDFRKFKDHLAEAGMALDAETLDRLREFGQRVVDRSETMNLVARGDLPRIYTRHILESLFQPLVDRAGAAGNLVDIGSGAGLPGIPLALACPGLKALLVEPRVRKAQFLEATVFALGLAGRVEVFQGTAESLGRCSGGELGAGLATARSVAELLMLWRWCQSLLRPLGWLATYKAEAEAEGEARSLTDPAPRQFEVSPLPWAPRALLLVQRP